MTAKQLQCIENGFTDKEKISFFLIWQQITSDKKLKSHIASLVEKVIRKNFGFQDYIEDEAVINCLLYNREYRHGFHFYRDKEIEPEKVHMAKNGINNMCLTEDMEEEYIEILKIIEGIKNI